MPGRVSAIFAKRKNDVCSDAALAASVVNPKHVLKPINPWTGKEMSTPWAPRGAQQAFRRVLGRVFGGNAKEVSAALQEHRKFLLGDDGFDDEQLQEIGENGTGEEYWFQVVLEGIEFSVERSNWTVTWSQGRVHEQCSFGIFYGVAQVKVVRLRLSTE